ncbi:MAG: catalase [Pseudomonadota bacterium]|nr:catalase [Pseudomonadota bacterium]
MPKTPAAAPSPKARTSGQSAPGADVKARRGVTGKTEALARDTVEAGAAMTGNQGVRISDDQNSLKAGPRGPTLMEDFHLREKITHFDHERIPERVVHARGTAAHGVFQVYEDLSDLTMAGLLTDPSRKTPVFVRFSTVAGFRGSTDCARDVRGFAVKFYTEEGVWDLVGNNMPVFFIQDAIKFPDLIHAVKPEPNNEIPQAASAHDTFWDFVSLTPESMHTLMWVMSDRGIPRSFAMMEGFGVHTFKLVNAAGKARFVKFHWKPLKGVKSLVWDEAQKISGKDSDFNRRDLFESIERGDYPQWELGLQIVEEKDEFKFDFDLLDPTKLIPEELVPVRRVGKLTLNRNPGNFFAETEQAAFHTGHIVPGIDFTNDPLLQGRLFSYIDTQLRRVGPNFAELPINRPLAPVHNNQRDAMGRTTIDAGRVSYFPNRLGGGIPAQSPADRQAFTTYPEKIDAAKVRVRADSFADHFSQATQFWNSMADWEKNHIAQAFAFELNQVESAEVRHHVMNELLVNVADALAKAVSAQTGIKIAPVGTPANPTPSAPSPSGPLRPHAKNLVSKALSQDKPGDSIKGRKIAILAGEGVDAAHLKAIKDAAAVHGALVELIAAQAGTVTDSAGKSQTVNRAQPNAPSVVYDAVIVPGGASAAVLAKSGLAVHFVNEAYRHGKPIAAIGGGKALLDACAIGPAKAVDGVIVGDAKAAIDGLIAALKRHRFPRRAIAGVPA